MANTVSTRKRQAVIQLNLCHLLADVLESALVDFSNKGKTGAIEMKFDQKKNFNNAIKSCQNLRISKLIGTNDEIKMRYGDDSDKVYHFIRLLFSRCDEDDDKWSKAYYLIKESMPEAFDIDISEGDDYFKIPGK